jgi:hypothetical protein
MNGASTSNTQGSLKSFYGYKETFGKDSVWVEVPRQRVWFNQNGLL